MTCLTRHDAPLSGILASGDEIAVVARVDEGSVEPAAGESEGLQERATHMVSYHSPWSRPFTHHVGDLEAPGNRVVCQSYP